MRLSKLTDLLLNVFFPLFLGYLIYFTAHTGVVIPVLKNYLPDGLWAYGLLSCILIIWDRQINIFWIIIILIFSILIEVLQCWRIIPGTGDILDVISYLAFFAIALMVNKYLNKKNKNTNAHENDRI